MPEECYYPLKNGWSKSSERGKESSHHPPFWCCPSTLITLIRCW
jgi:hypothetical protein